MKILFYTYPSAFQTPGGGEKQLFQYYNYLKKKNIQVDKFDSWNQKQKIENYNIIHFFSVMPGGSASFLRYVKNHNKKIIISPNTWIEEKDNHPDFVEIKYCLHLADKIVVNSEMEAKQLSNIFEMDKKKFHVIYNFIDKNYLSKPKKNYKNFKKFNINKPFILSVGNVETRKNQLKIVKALRDCKEIQYVNIGNIREANYYEKILNLKAKNCIFLNQTKNIEMLKNFYSNCSLFLLPSYVETPSIAALEAGSQGAKILITSKGSTKEYFKNNVKYILPDFNLVDLKKRVLKLICDKKDDNLKKLIKSKYTYSKQLKNLINLYSKLNS